MKNSKLLPYLVIIGIILFVIVVCIESKRGVNSIQLLDPDYDVGVWETVKICSIIVVSLLMVGRGLITFWLCLIFFAAMFQFCGLGIILNLDDLNLTAVIAVGTIWIFYSCLKDIFGKGK